VFVPLGRVQHLVPMAFQPFAAALQGFAPAPLSLPLQATSFSFHHFAPSDLVSGDLLLSFRAILLRFRGSSVRRARAKQAGSKC
jgi:hypothetical protein